MPYPGSMELASLNRAAIRLKSGGSLVYAVLVVLGSVCGAAQQAGSPPPQRLERLELPAVMQQKIIAGITPAGTAIRAKLSIATLVKGKVLPSGAVLSGHLEESAKRNGNTPSRLKIKFDTAQWKNGTTTLELYFTGCYYPFEITPEQDPASAIPDGLHGSLTMGQVTSSPSHATPSALGQNPLPNDYGTNPGELGGPHVSSRWVREEGTEIMAEPDGSVVVTSAKRNLKLDKGTTYLLTNAIPVAKH